MIERFKVVIYHIICIYMYHRLFWSYKLPKYGESSAKAVLSNVHRTKAGSVVAKAPRKDLWKHHVSIMKYIIYIYDYITLLNTAHLTSEKLLKLLAKQNGPLLARLERVQVGPEVAGWFWRVQELQTPNIHRFIRRKHPHFNRLRMIKVDITVCHSMAVASRLITWKAIDKQNFSLDDEAGL